MVSSTGAGSPSEQLEVDGLISDHADRCKQHAQPERTYPGGPAAGSSCAERLRWTRKVRSRVSPARFVWVATGDCDTTERQQRYFRQSHIYLLSGFGRDLVTAVRMSPLLGNLKPEMVKLDKIFIPFAENEVIINVHNHLIIQT